MKVGDRVRTKEEYPGRPKGSIGEIIYINEVEEDIRVRYETGINGVYSYSNFNDFVELISMDKKVTCPVALVNWYKACTPYIGGNNG